MLFCAPYLERRPAAAATDAGKICEPHVSFIWAAFGWRSASILPVSTAMIS